MSLCPPRSSSNRGPPAPFPPSRESYDSDTPPAPYDCYDPPPYGHYPYSSERDYYPTGLPGERYPPRMPPPPPPGERYPPPVPRDRLRLPGERYPPRVPRDRLPLPGERYPPPVPRDRLPPPETSLPPPVERRPYADARDRLPLPPRERMPPAYEDCSPYERERMPPAYEDRSPCERMPPAYEDRSPYERERMPPAYEDRSPYERSRVLERVPPAHDYCRDRSPLSRPPPAHDYCRDYCSPLPRPPPEYYDRPPPVIRVSDKVMIPQEEHPHINFVGLLIGPRGNTLKNLVKETGANVHIRGKSGLFGRKDGQPLHGEDEPLHAYVTANNPENVKKAVEKIKDIIKQRIKGQNDLRRQQRRELDLLRENDGLAKSKQLQQAQTIITNTIVCSVCGGTGHIAQDCKQKNSQDMKDDRKALIERNKQLEEENMKVTRELERAVDQNTRMCERAIKLEQGFRQQAGVIFDLLSSSIHEESYPQLKAEPEVSRLEDSVICMGDQDCFVVEKDLLVIHIDSEMEEDGTH